MFQTSKIEISSSKNIFTHHLYQKCPDSLLIFFEIFLTNPASISFSPKGLDLDYGQILGLKQNKQLHMSFTPESHTQKLALLMIKLDGYVQNQIQGDK